MSYLPLFRLYRHKNKNILPITSNLTPPPYRICHGYILLDCCKCVTFAAPVGYLIKHTELHFDPDQGHEPVPAFRLDSHPVSACEIARNGSRVRWAIPVRLNGDEAKLMAVSGGDFADLHVLGAVPTGEDPYHLLNKKIIPLCEGDQIVPRHPAYPAAKRDAAPAWLDGKPFTLSGEIQLCVEVNPYLHDMLHVLDTERNSHYLPVGAGGYGAHLRNTNRAS